MARAAAIAASITVAGALGLGVWYAFLVPQSGDRFAECRASAVAGGQAAIGGDFTLTDQTGARVTAAEVIDGPTLIYFGYTFCPDVCPLDTVRMADAVDRLAEAGVDATPVFVTVDPERDTPEVLDAFTGNIHPGMVGLTGTREEIDAVMRAWKAFAQRSATSAADDEYYLVDHSTLTYLHAPGEGFLEFFRRDVSAEAMAERVACFTERL
ncbi:MAG: SCO family protein [Pseudomonadota bacterium]